jgi:hypothetical protein
MAGPPSRHSFPAPSEPSLRRLGVGGGGGGDRPLRAQIVVALAVLLVLVGVPLYMWRRPSGDEDAKAQAEAAAQSAAAASAADAEEAPEEAGTPPEERVRIGPVQRVKCSASSGSRGQEGNLCDALPFFEEALAKSIRENVDCAPRMGKEGTINYVLRVDFTRRQYGVFAGASGTWKGPQAKRSAKCVKRGLAAPQWEKIQHQYRYYLIAVLATYPPPAPPAGPPGAPVFD